MKNKPQQTAANGKSTGRTASKTAPGRNASARSQSSGSSKLGIIIPVILIVLSALLIIGVVVYAIVPTPPAESIQTLRDYVRSSVGVGKGLTMLKENDNLQVFLYLESPKTEEDKAKVDEEPLILSVISFHTDNRFSYRLNLYLDKNEPDTVKRHWRFSDRELGTVLMEIDDTITPRTYKGSERINTDLAETHPLETIPETEADTSVETLPPLFGQSKPVPMFPELLDSHIQSIVKDMTNMAIITLEAFTQERLDLDRKDFGFKSYSDKNGPLIGGGIMVDTTPSAALPDHLAPDCLSLSTDGAVAGTTADATTADTASDEDLGGPFSAERWGYAGRMTLLGVGMVFAVLGFLWAVLAIFKRVFVGKEPRAEKPAKVEKPAKPAKVENSAAAQAVAAPAPVAPAAPANGELDPVIVAAITAAIAATIESDPDLSEQFIGGFRVVSFKRKSGKASWNR